MAKSPDPQSAMFGPVKILAGLFLLLIVVSALLQWGGVQRLIQITPELATYSGPTMGTAYSVKVVAPDQPHTELGRLITEALDAVNRRMSTYLPQSELSQFNAAKSTEPIKMSDMTLEVLDMAAEVSRASGGAFDVTVGPLVNAWGFGPAAPAKRPAPDDIEQLLNQVGYDKIVVDRAAGTVQKTNPEVYCDLSGIAKGYAVDVVAEALEAAGYVDYLVEVGGEVRARGRNAAGQPWQVAIERPDVSGRSPHRILGLSGLALATSGGYRNFIDVDGERLTHTIDPQTGRPVTHKLASASVIHDSCAMADAWATAILVRGPEAGFELAKRHELAVLLLVHDGDGGFVERTTPEFEQIVAGPDAGTVLR